MVGAPAAPATTIKAGHGGTSGLSVMEAPSPRNAAAWYSGPGKQAERAGYGRTGRPTLGTLSLWRTNRTSRGSISLSTAGTSPPVLEVENLQTEFHLRTVKCAGG